MQGNDFIKFLLRSPLQGMLGDNLMLITVTGRKSGRLITTPVNYFRDGDSLWIISDRDRKWWRNVCGGAEVTLRIHGRDMRGCAESFLDEKDVAAEIGDYVRHLLMAAKPLGVRLDQGVANCDDAARLSKKKLFVKIKLKS